MAMTLEPSWHRELKEELAKPYIAELKAFLGSEEKRPAT